MPLTYYCLKSMTWVTENLSLHSFIVYLKPIFNVVSMICESLAAVFLQKDYICSTIQRVITLLKNSIFFN